MMRPNYSNLFAIFSIFAGSLFIFLWGLDSQEIIGFDSRFYLFAQEMLRNGINWFPTTYHQLYPDYPATSTILIFLAANTMGGLTKLTAILPSAIAASLTLICTYAIGALHQKRWGWCAVFLALLTIGFMKDARSISLDMYLSFITACCFYLVYSADVKQCQKRYGWIYPLLFLGFAFRGPIGLIIPTGVVCIYYLLDLRIKKFLLTGFFALLLLILSSVCLLFIAHQLGGNHFVKDVLRMQMLGRIDNNFQPLYFYFLDSLTNYALSFPIACLVLLGIVYYSIKHRFYSAEFKLVIKLIGWTSIILIGMTIPGDKKIRYILPMIPAVALIAAYPFIAPSNEKYFIFLRKLISFILTFLPFILLAASFYISSYTNKHDLNIGIPYNYFMIFLAAMQFVSLLICFPKRFPARDIILFLIAVICFVVTDIFILEPIELYIERAKNFVQQVEVLRKQKHARLVFYKERADGLPIKYIINMPSVDRELPLFVNDEKALLTYPPPVFFVASKTYFDELPKEIAMHLHVVAEDTLGHIPVVVFARNEE